MNTRKFLFWSFAVLFVPFALVLLNRQVVTAGEFNPALAVLFETPDVEYVTEDGLWCVDNDDDDEIGVCYTTDQVCALWQWWCPGDVAYPGVEDETYNGEPLSLPEATEAPAVMRIVTRHGRGQR